MFLTKECDYGIRIIRALADGEKRSVRTISDREHVPKQYAYKILKKLENSGFVQSHQGPAGGYQLVKPLSDFTLYDVISAVDDTLLLFECVQEDYSCLRDTPEQPCKVHQEFCRLHEIMAAGLREKTMAQVMSSEE